MSDSFYQEKKCQEEDKRTGLLLKYILDHTEFTSSRLPSLYSDFFPLKNSNFEGYQANTNAWKSALEDAVWAGKIEWTCDYLVIHCDNRLSISLYSPKYGIPLGIKETMEYSLEKGEWIRLCDFFKKKDCIYSYALSYMSNFVAWSLGRIGKYILKKAELDTSCIILEHVERAENAFLTVVQDKIMYSEHIYSFDGLVRCFSNKIFSSRILSELDMKIMIYHLSRNKKEATISEDGQIIKLRRKSDARVLNITETDHLISNLKTIFYRLKRLTQTLTQNIIHLDESIKTAIQSKNKTLAMFQLRSKKASELTLNKRLQSLEQVKEILSKIDEAVIHLDILNSMKAGVEVLENLVKEIADIENVKDIMEKFKELSYEVDCIGDTLGTANLNNISDIEIEQEFEKLCDALKNEVIEKPKEDAEIEIINNMFADMDLEVPSLIPHITSKRIEETQLFE
ncbi:hypothetical protein PNEG_02934 [Pneumocystis murina B123]|uniref:Charged multivesicular body protein 7 n=1 Tax=Pneumocystis murina (strain B123) TaxID=1069680 RepID=M7PE88_PNEMU|nr:hypothetical protein PNEG_02934 [Pneumocystis murina B123]EMR08764.1 hypothetical protein PNEG_02934 [Pneumocystis murina B123]